MFISNAERIQLKKDIETLSKIVGELNTEVMFLSAKIKVLEGKGKEPKKTRTMSPENRAKLSAMMKARHAKKKLEKQNGNSVSTSGQ